MASVVPYTKKMLIQRLRKHMANGFPNDEFAASDHEIMLYIDQAAAFQCVGQAYAGAKVDGNLVVPEAYYTTYSLPALLQDQITSYWYTTLPQTPISLPLGYSIENIYAASGSFGVSQPVFLIEAKRVPYRNMMPRPGGIFGWVEGLKLFLQASDGSPLFGLTFYVTMVKTRTENINEALFLPDDAIQGIFDAVVKELTNRYAQPKDIIVDDVGAGSNTQKQ